MHRAGAFVVTQANRQMLSLSPDFQCCVWDLDKRYNLFISRHFYVSIYYTRCNIICLLHYLCSILSGTTFPLDRRWWHIKEASNKHLIFCLYYFFSEKQESQFNRDLVATVWTWLLTWGISWSLIALPPQ